MSSVGALLAAPKQGFIKHISEVKLNSEKNNMERLFCPEGLAIIGVSATNITSFGTMFLKANLDADYEGQIYPVGAKGGEIFGLKIYRSLDEIPGPVDLACVAVPADGVLAVLDECVRHGIPGAQILTAGFGELGTAEGKRLEAEIAAFKNKGLRIIGPNCFGIHCPTCGLTILPGGGFPKNPGPVAFFGQSGGMAVDLGYSSPGLGFGWRRMVSYGNACDVDGTELLNIFADDPQCKIITGYVEGVRDGRSFLEAVKAASFKKPVILWKAGLTESGSRAVMSHTGSMGGAEAVWEGALRQVGAVPVSNQEELLDTVIAFLHLGEWAGKGIAVVGGGGALGVAIADSADRHGFRLPEFSPQTRAAMEKLLPPVGNSLRNPADVGNPMVPPNILGPIMESAARDPNIDIVILIQIVHHITSITRMHIGKPEMPLEKISWHNMIANVCRDVREKTGVPVMQLLPPISSDEGKLEVESVLRKWRAASHAAGVITYPSLERAISALDRVATYWKWMKSRK